MPAVGSHTLNTQVWRTLLDGVRACICVCVIAELILTLPFRFRRAIFSNGLKCDQWALPSAYVQKRVGPLSRANTGEVGRRRGWRREEKESNCPCHFLELTRGCSNLCLCVTLHRVAEYVARHIYRPGNRMHTHGSRLVQTCRQPNFPIS